MQQGLSRRNFVLTGLASAAAPAPSCAQGSSQLTPESFGAAGDGVTDDYDAFRRMAAAISSTGGGAVALRAGRTYFLNRHVAPGNGVSDVTFRNCARLAIDGNGASISLKGDVFRATRAIRPLAGLVFEDCRNVEIRDLELIGNVQRTTRPQSVVEGASHGLIFGGCSDVVIDSVTARHFAADGMYVRASLRPGADGRHRASRRFTVRNSRFLYNARQGLSVIQLRDATFDACEFSWTGYVDSGLATGPYGHHAPAAGVDVEPNATLAAGQRVDVLTGKLGFRDCRFVGNVGSSFIAVLFEAIDRTALERCTLECSAASPSRYGFMFDVSGSVTGCTLKMIDKTAFLGWSARSNSSPTFSGNSVSGHSGGPNRPFFMLRPTRGAPLIEANEFAGDRHPNTAGSPTTSQLVWLDNSNATVRQNRFFLPAQDYPPTARGLVPAVLANVSLMEANRYKTDLTPGSSGRARIFGVMYGRTCHAEAEIFQGTRPGLSDTVQPADLSTRRPRPHDSRMPWSK